MSERQGVEIDYCPNCRGMWLDRGELDKLLDRVANTFVPSSVPQNRNQHYHEATENNRSKSYYRDRKKSWLEEIFD